MVTFSKIDKQLKKELEQFREMEAFQKEHNRQ